MRITTLATFSAAALLGCVLPTQARVVQIQYGDIDGGTYNGPASADHVYVDPSWVSELVDAAWPGPYSDLDVSRYDHNVPFTFLFPLQPDERVTAATLTLGLRSTFDRDVVTDAVLLENPDQAGDGRYNYADLTWSPLPSSPTAIRTLDLASALGRNLLSALQDGQLNVNVRDDSLVDYAILNLTIVPEPTPLSLLALSAIPFLARRRCC
jgi:hypothetical protein